MYPDNSTAQVMHCRCPRNSVAYLVKRHAYQTEAGLGYQFSFACSPQTVSGRCYLAPRCRMPEHCPADSGIPAGRHQPPNHLSTSHILTNT